SYDPAAIGDLFSEDAEYRFHPWDRQPVRGRAAIVGEWLAPGGDAAQKDDPGSWDGNYEAWVVDGRRACAIGVSRYWSDAAHSTLARVYDNAWLLEFDDDGRCRTFTEYYMTRPDDAKA
ncbi:MAG TPA: hypothetical protein VIV06_10700, partial [Candidatus Limnocylindrales bacterium]